MNKQMGTKQWDCILAGLKPGSDGVSLTGKPGRIKSPYGEAVWFDGEKDGIFISENPLKGLISYTVEAIFCPDKNGPEEQRFLHIGEIDGDRMLIETRTTRDNNWYLDTFIMSGEAKKALINPALVHPIGPWYHVALTVDMTGKMRNYINGEFELEGHVGRKEINSGEMSAGVRRNKVSWFKGAIYRIRITPGVLRPEDFMKI
jgi:hypothetical protein